MIPPFQPNPVLEDKSFSDLPAGYFLVTGPSLPFARTAKGAVIQHLSSLPPNDTIARVFALAGPTLIPGRYRGLDALVYSAAPPGPTMLEGAATPLTQNPQPVTVIAVGGTASARGTAFAAQTGTPESFEAGSGLICFDDSSGNTVTYPASDVRGLSVFTWQTSLGAAPPPFLFRINGTQRATVGTTPTPLDGSPGYTLGNLFAGTRPWDGPLEVVAVWPRILTADEIDAAERILVHIFGTVKHPSFLSDNGSISIQRAQTNYGASFCTTRVETMAQSLTAIYSASGGSSSQVWVIVDGEIYQAFDVPSGGALHEFTINLDGRTHIVEFWDSLQTDTGSNTLCSTLIELRGSYTLLPTAIPETRVSVYGNSITQGAFAGFVPLGGTLGLAGWWQLWRFDQSFDGRVSNIGSGGRALHSDFTIDPTMVTLAQWLTSQAAEVVPGNRRTIWYAGIELNDWQQSQWTAAAFGASLATLVAAIFAIDPTITIVLQSSIVALNQANPNGLGDDLAAYRAQVAAVAAANVDHCIFVDGLAANNGEPAVTLAQLADDVHPGPAGHISYSAWAKVTRGLQYTFEVPLDGLIAWYRADQGITLTAGNVSEWDSYGRSGDANRNALQAVAGDRPPAPLPTVDLNNQPSLVFTQGGNGALVTNSWAAAGSALPSPCTIYFVGKAAAGANHFFFDSLPADIPANRIVFYTLATGPILRIGATDIPIQDVDPTVPHIYCFVIGPGTLVQIFVDDMHKSNVAVSGFAPVHPTGFTFGNAAGLGFAQGGEHAEDMFYNVAHGQAERNLVGEYLGNRYGIPVVVAPEPGTVEQTFLLTTADVFAGGPTSGIRRVSLTGCGGGGGGGGGEGGLAAGLAGTGGGGGGAAVLQSVIVDIDFSHRIDIQVGTAGASGAAGAGANGAGGNGGDGGTTYVLDFTTDTILAAFAGASGGGGATGTAAPGQGGTQIRGGGVVANNSGFAGAGGLGGVQGVSNPQAGNFGLATIGLVPSGPAPNLFIAGPAGANGAATQGGGGGGGGAGPYGHGGTGGNGNAGTGTPGDGATVNTGAGGGGGGGGAIAGSAAGSAGGIGGTGRMITAYVP